MDDHHRAQLLRQREAIAQHLAWLDAEIAATSASPPRAESPRRSPEPFFPSTQRDPEYPDSLLERYRVESQNGGPFVSKTGCWLVFAFTLFALISGVALVVFLSYR